MGHKKGPQLRSFFHCRVLKALALHLFGHQFKLSPAVEHERTEQAPSNEDEQNAAVDGCTSHIAATSKREVIIIVIAWGIARIVYCTTWATF